MELPELSPVSDPPYRKHSLGKLAGVIQRQWSNMPEGVKPYLAALFTLKSVQDRYGFDSGRSIVSQLLSHMAGWKGETAREVKAELRRRLK